MNHTELSKCINEKIQNNIPPLRDDTVKHMHLDYIDYALTHNPTNILVIPIEEMAELTKELSKILRKKKTETDNIGLLEELADVQICIDNLRTYFNISDDDFNRICDIKLERGFKQRHEAALASEPCPLSSLQNVSLGHSKNKILTAVGGSPVHFGPYTRLLEFYHAGDYTGRITNNNGIIDDSYRYICTFATYVNIYDDTTCVLSLRANRIHIYQNDDDNIIITSRKDD